jgi:hypothetical protein
MPPETEVIACPACKHLVRVPADWLGQTVQCPECKAAFTAPTRQGDRLTDAVLLSRPDAPAAAAAPRGRADLMLLLPAFGLMLTGFASLVVNTWLTVHFLNDRAGAEAYFADVLKRMGTPDEEAAKAAAEKVGTIRALIAGCAVLAGLEFYAGLAITLRRHYRMAQLGCVLAAVNVANGCCVPGALFGAWGLLMLMSDEGREHFRR